MKQRPSVTPAAVSLLCVNHHRGLTSLHPHLQLPLAAEGAENHLLLPIGGRVSRCIQAGLEETEIEEEEEEKRGSSYLQSLSSRSKCGLKLMRIFCPGSGAVMTHTHCWEGGYALGYPGEVRYSATSISMFPPHLSAAQRHTLI